MPALSNPRYERFAQALFAGLAGETRIKRAQSTAYLAAYPNCSKGNPAEAAASRLLRRVKPIADRVRELQAQALARIDRKLDISRERIGRRLDLASRKAESDGNPIAIISAETALAKIFGLIKTTSAYDPNDLDNAQSAEQLAMLLLQSVGLDPPFTALELERAGRANDVFVAELEHIKAQRQLRSVMG
jgi:hypothetical protein